MDWLNYHHLLYFWMVVKEGGIAAASRKLHVGRPSVSMQIKTLETSLGAPLFERRGRRLILTETGRLVHDYADDIFRTGKELMEAVRGGASGRPQRLRVGIADVMAKLVAVRLLLPAMDQDEALRLDCREGPAERLFALLAVHEIDLVLSDVPLSPNIDVKAYNHLVGESTITLFARPELRAKLGQDFPGSLNGAPMLLPGRDSVIRIGLQRWLDEHAITPSIVGEFEDSAMLKVFGQFGRGVFPAPTVVRELVCQDYGVEALAELETVRDRFYAISPERRIKHPSVQCIVERARSSLFSESE